MVDVDVHILSHLKEELAWAIEIKGFRLLVNLKISKSTKELKGTKKAILNLKQYCSYTLLCSSSMFFCHYPTRDLQGRLGLIIKAGSHYLQATSY